MSLVLTAYATQNLSCQTGIPSKEQERPSVALVLGGGGARGFGIIPVLEVIDELGIPIDMIIGNSIGAIIGGLYSIGYTPEEIRQTATADQQDVVDRANQAFGEKSDAANAAKSLTALDAMKIQIANLRQQYLKSLMKPTDPVVDVVSTSRAGLCHTAKLENEADIDQYVADIKAKLIIALGNHDVLHII